MSLLPPIILPPPAALSDFDLARATTRPGVLGAWDGPSRSPHGRASPLCGHGSGLYSHASQRASPLSLVPSDDDEAAFLEETFVLSRSRAVLVRTPALGTRRVRDTPIDDVTQVSDAQLPMTTVLTAMAAAAKVRALEDPSPASCADGARRQTTPPDMYSLRSDWPAPKSGQVWVVYGTHDEVSIIATVLRD